MMIRTHLYCDGGQLSIAAMFTKLALFYYKLDMFYVFDLKIFFFSFYQMVCYWLLTRGQCLQKQKLCDLRIHTSGSTVHNRLLVVVFEC